MTHFRSEAESLRGEMIGRRRDFHRHPELAFEEFRTAAIVAETLRALDFDVRTAVGKTGVVAALEADRDGPTVMVRCDMDALPIQEKNETAYASETPSIMHACGHDGHTAIGLAVAKMLARHRAEMRGTLKFVFQPAEEIGKGACAMIEDGALRDPAPTVCFGLHVWNELPVGEIAITSGAVMAGADSFHGQIRGRGGHGALPHLGRDPVLAAAYSITAMQSVVSRNLSPLDSAVISVTQLQAGQAVNIIPDDVSFSGTIRTFTTRSEICSSSASKASDGDRQGDGLRGNRHVRTASPVVNDPEVTDRLAVLIEKSAPDRSSPGLDAGGGGHGLFSG
jgi:amidohydrolase